MLPRIKVSRYKQHFGKGFDNLWARGYYCGSAGHVSQEQVKRYIQEQQGKDVFEYDIYGCPTQLKGQLKNQEQPKCSFPIYSFIFSNAFSLHQNSSFQHEFQLSQVCVLQL